MTRPNYHKLKRSLPDDVHVVPDWGRAHDAYSTCWCKPKQHPMNPDVLVHRADGRIQSIAVDGDRETLQ